MDNLPFHLPNKHLMLNYYTITYWSFHSAKMRILRIVLMWDHVYWVHCIKVNLNSDVSYVAQIFNLRSVTSANFTIFFPSQLDMMLKYKKLKIMI